MALQEKTNAYLSTFQSHKFKVDELYSAVPLRSATAQQAGQTENYTRMTQDGTMNVTGLTEFSDEGLVMDPEDKGRAVVDLKAFKDNVSTLKFAYLESNIKLQFVRHVIEKMEGDVPQLVTTEETAALEKERLKTKAELKVKKVRAAELESQIRQQATLLDSRLQTRKDQAALAAALVKECEAMETELAILKNKRSPIQRITIEEAQEICAEQELKLASIGPDIKACEASMKEKKVSIRTHKVGIEKLGGEMREMKREEEERDAMGQRDERSEQSCLWITSATALFSSLLGVRSAQSVGSPPTSMTIIFEGPQRTEGDYRTLSIEFSPQGTLVGARLLDSSITIQDIVEAHLVNQDLRGMVQEIRARLGQ